MSTVTPIDYVLAFPPNKVYRGQYPSGTMTQVGASGLVTGLRGQWVERADMVDPVDALPKVYAVDGSDSIEVDIANDFIQPWSAAVIARNLGTLPASCALCCRYNGRIVLARQPNNAAIWYMSRKGNALDWQFGATPLATAAIAGTDPSLGVIGDAITALIPSGDDCMFFGCQSSIYGMIGDPGAGGIIGNITRRTGVLGPRAFCFDDNDRLLFMANNGLNVLEGPTGKPQPLTGNRLIGLLDRVDVSATLIEMAFDAFKREAHVFLTPLDGTTVGTHVVVDRSGFIGLDQYPTAAYGPWSSLAVDGEDDQNRRVLLGSSDGYIRQFDDSLKADDAVAIESYVDFPIVQAEQGLREITLTEAQAFGGQSSGAASWKLFGADSADEVRQLSTSEVASGTFFSDAGYNVPQGLRCTAGAFKFRILQSSASLSWSLERLMCKAVPFSRRR